MNIDPGKFDKKIVIYAKSDEKDSDGFRTGEKTDAKTVWASFSRLSGTEKMKAGIDLAEEKVRFLCRYRAGITAGMFVEYAGAVYNIIFANDYGDRHKYMEIVAQKG